MTQHCHVHKAQPIGHVDQPESVYVSIHETIPDMEPAAKRATFEGDAARLADALFDALPGGTIDQLLAEMLSRRASLLRVRFPATDGGPS